MRDRRPHIDGQVTTLGFEKWIEVLNVSFGIHRETRMATGGNAREGAHPEIQEIQVSKHFDQATLSLQSGQREGPRQWPPTEAPSFRPLVLPSDVATVRSLGSVMIPVVLLGLLFQQGQASQGVRAC